MGPEIRPERNRMEPVLGREGEDSAKNPRFWPSWLLPPGAVPEPLPILPAANPPLARLLVPFAMRVVCGLDPLPLPSAPPTPGPPQP